MPLLNLPNELLKYVMDELDMPDDFYNFATCCKALSSFAKLRLEEHRKLCDTYGKVLVGHLDEYDHGEGRRIYKNPVQMLDDVLNDARIAKHIKRLSIDCYKDVWPHWDETEDEIERLKAQMIEMEPVIDECRQIPERRNTIWQREMMNTRYIVDIIDSIYYHRGVNNGHSIAVQPFSKLAYLDINLEDSDEYRQFNLLNAMAAIPSLQSIKLTNGVLDESEDEDQQHVSSDTHLRIDHIHDFEAQSCTKLNIREWKSYPHGSNVTEISFDNSQFKPCCLSSFLYGVKALEAFVYEWTETSRWETCTPRDMREALFKHARHSLKKLHITGLNRPNGSIGSLRLFPALRDVALDFCELYNSSNYLSTLGGFLPPAIEIVKFRMRPSKGESKSLQREIHSLLTDFLDYFPKLNRITFDLSWLGLSPEEEPIELHVILEILGFKILEGPRDWKAFSRKGPDFVEGSFLIGVRYLEHFPCCIIKGTTVPAA
ncbi:MAG: hypothetical protein Q9187_008276 [Circinaria calcarea]